MLRRLFADTRAGLNTFDAKYYLRLVEHVTDAPERDPTAQEAPYMSSRISFGGGTSVAPFCRSNSGIVAPEGAKQDVVEDDEIPGTEMERYDTDRTIIFPTFKDIQSNDGKHEKGHLSRIPSLRTQELRRYGSLHQSSNVELSIPPLRHSQSNPPSVTAAEAASVPNGRVPENTALSADVENSTKTPSRFSSSYSHAAPAPLDLERHRKSDGSSQLTSTTRQPTDGGRESNLSQKPVDIAVFSAASEPYGSSKLDSARVDVGRMTRLRNPEWDTRRPLTPSTHRSIPLSRNNLSASPHDPSDNRNLTTQPIEVKQQNSAFDRPPPEFPRVPTPAMTTSLAFHSPRVRPRGSRFHHKKPRKGDARTTKRQSNQQSDKESSPRTQSSELNEERSTESPKPQDRRSQLMKSIKERETLPHRVVSAPLGKSNVGGLGFDGPFHDSSIGSSEEYLEVGSASS